MKKLPIHSQVDPRRPLVALPDPAYVPGSPPTCHPDRPHAAKGLCARCYAAWHYAANLDKRRAQMKAANVARKAQPIKLRPYQQLALDEARTSPSPGYAAALVRTGMTALTFFAKPKPRK